MAIIIVECCQNHKGDLKILKEMIWAAAEAGADYVKIQSMMADELTFRERFEQGVVENDIVKAIKRSYQLEYDRLKPMDLDDDAHYWFIEECQAAGIKPMTTVFTRKRLKFVSTLPFQAIKVASYDCRSFPFIKELLSCFQHLFISTGATFDDEIKKAASLLKGHDYTFLHCVTIYPTPLNELHLARMKFLRRYAPSVGFSDHALTSRDGIKGSIVALALGADVVERHYTVLPAEETKDGPVSINPQQLAELVKFARMPNKDLMDFVKKEIGDYAEMIGLEERALTHTEILNRDYYGGRFASKINGQVVYNWEESELV